VSDAYRQAGVDIEAGDRFVETIRPAVTETWSADVIGGFGGFAAGIRIPKGYERPVLMMSTDGVGTKLEIASRTDRWGGVGFDVVAMCVDDLAAVGAQPIGFTDYLAVGKLDRDREERIVQSVADACIEAGCALLGGETAEHPDVVKANHLDIAGAALGVIEEGTEITGQACAAGDVLIGVASPNLRSNGYSLVRSVIDMDRLDAIFPGDDRSFGEVLTEPSVIYATSLLAAIETGGVNGLAHITGGGLPGNVRRFLPNNLDAIIDISSWQPPNAFRYLVAQGGLSQPDAYATFNMGVGFVIAVQPSKAEEIRSVMTKKQHETYVIGQLAEGSGYVQMTESTTSSNE